VAYLIVAVYAAAPLAALGADNGRLVRVVDLVPYYAGLVLPAVLVIALVGRRRGRSAANIVAACLAVTILVAFDYWDIRPRLASLTNGARPSMIFLWAVVLLVALVVTTRLARRFRQLPLAMLLAGVIWLVPSLVAWADAGIQTPERAGLGFALSAQRLTTRPGPNVWFFMLDAYSRADRLRQQFAFDDTPFLRTLRKEGFVIPPRTQSAYGTTPLSVPTMLNMRYTLASGVLDLESVSPVFKGHNTVADTFRALGYAVALAPSQLLDWECDGSEELCIHPTQTYASHLGLSPLAYAVMERTPAADVLRSIAPVHLNPLTSRRQFPSRVVDAVLHRNFDRPVFTFVHSLLPHWPYLYLGPRCKLAATRGRLGAAAYIQAVRCTNADTEEAVRRILRRDPRAVIVLASDHGTDVEVNGDVSQWEWPRRTIERRFSNFVALRLPRGCRRHVPRELNEVNIFRIVLNCLTTPNLSMLQPRRYLTGIALDVRPDRPPLSP
jgi:hypothetical protein